MKMRLLILFVMLVMVLLIIGGINGGDTTVEAREVSGETAVSEEEALQALTYGLTPGDTATSSLNALLDNGEKIVYTSTGEDGHLFSMAPDGTSIQEITTASEYGPDHTASVSHDGTKIVFDTSRLLTPFIYTVGIDGSNLTQLDNTHYTGSPDWSPDGNEIVFTSFDFDGVDNDIYKMNADGSNWQPLVINQAQDDDPSWSPIGNKIAYSSDFGSLSNSFEIFVMDADGSNQTPLTQSPGADTMPAWSPDGSKIAFVSDRDGQDEIYVMSADGSNQVRITFDNARDYFPTWSPDGSKIAFTSDRYGDEQIFVMNSDGSNVTQITFDGGHAPDWSAPLKKKAWTLMYFFATDNDLTNESVDLNRAINEDNVYITIFRDHLGKKDAYLSAFSPGFLLTTLDEEPNTGTSQTLVDFIEWSQENYPSDHYALILVGHMNGVAGIGPDQNPNTDTDGECKDRNGNRAHCLSFKELQTSLNVSTIQKIEVLYLSGCSSALGEVAYELRGLVDYLVASQQYYHFLTRHADYVNFINSNTTGFELANAIADHYYNLSINSNRPSTISAMALSRITYVKDAADTLAISLNNHFINPVPFIDNILDEVQRFSFDSDHDIERDDYYIDLYRFAQLVYENTNDNQIQTDASNLMTEINTMIIEEHHRSGSYENNYWGLDHSHGISVYFPDKSSSFYNELWLDFAEGANWNFDSQIGTENRMTSQTTVTKWGSFISEYVRLSNPNEPDIVSPPPLLAPIPNFKIYLPLTKK